MFFFQDWIQRDTHLCFFLQFFWRAKKKTPASRGLCCRMTFKVCQCQRCQDSMKVHHWKNGKNSQDQNLEGFFTGLLFRVLKWWLNIMIKFWLIKIHWVVPPPSNCGKWRFIGIPDPKNVMSSWWWLASWEGGQPKWYIIIIFWFGSELQFFQNSSSWGRFFQATLWRKVHGPVPIPGFHGIQVPKWRIVYHLDVPLEVRING